VYVVNFCSVANPKSISIVVVSERLVEKVKMCEIRSDIYGASDHVPVVMEIESDIITGN
jgi:AP endonuclease-1